MIEFPFTADEMRSGLALAFPPEHAATLADDILNAMGRGIGWSLSFETLALLSLATPELERKVEEVRHRLVPALDGMRCTMMRESLKRAISNGPRV